MSYLSKLSLVITLVCTSLLISKTDAYASEYTIPISALEGLVGENATVYLMSGATVVREAVVQQISPAETFGALVVGALAGAAIGECVKLLILNREDIGKFFGGMWFSLRTKAADRNRLHGLLNKNVTPAIFYEAAEDAQKNLKFAAGPKNTLNLDDGFQYIISGKRYELRQYRVDRDPQDHEWDYEAALPFHREFMEVAMNSKSGTRDFFNVVNNMIDDQCIKMTYNNGHLYYIVNPEASNRHKFILKVQLLDDDQIIDLEGGLSLIATSIQNNGENDLGFTTQERIPNRGPGQPYELATRVNPNGDVTVEVGSDESVETAFTGGAHAALNATGEFEDIDF